MGLSTALYTGVSGLNANGTDLSVIGNNIANTNTVGYKGGRAAFGDILSSSMGGGSAFQIGRGVSLQSVATQFTQGTLETTSNALDLAIEGDGFFIVKDTAGAQYYTRAGQYKLNKDGNIINPEGLRLQGYLTQQGGVLGTINVSSLNSPPKSSANVTVSANLNSATTVKDPTTMNNFTIDSTNNVVYVNGAPRTLATGSYTGAALAAAFQAVLTPLSTTATVTYNTAGANIYKFTINNPAGGGAAALTFDWANSATTAEHMFGYYNGGAPIVVAIGGSSNSAYRAAGFDPNNGTTTSDFSTSMTVYDSLGNSHLLNVYLKKIAENTTLINDATKTGNRWAWWTVAPSTDSITGQLQVGAQGYLEFDTGGKLIADIQDYNSFNFSGGVTQGQLLAFDFGQSMTQGGSGLAGTTQFGSPNSVLFQSQDGYTSGSLQSLIVDQNGAMTGVFSNGQTAKVADVALAR
ncbi:MAG: flagellar hook-basal body complex protein, partial [Nitrospirae bacterium]|nr:flagellar hook-basal body complex protein [Nitrospirota bacterium]